MTYSMKDKVFIDTNVFVYVALEDAENLQKREAASSILQDSSIEFFISTQVINEFYTVMLRNGVSDLAIQERIKEMIKDTDVLIVNLHTIKKTWEIKNKLKYSYWDSLIIASALESDCSVLYTEDMQDRHVIEAKLTIVNPFH